MIAGKRWWVPTLALLGSVVAAACADAAPTAPEDAAAEIEVVTTTGNSAQASIDVSGEWEWRREELFTLPAEFSFVFGIQPEGPVTHFRCDVEGVITLTQAGEILSGVETETWSRCETRGGQVFLQPGLGVPIPIPEGRVSGHRVKLVIGDAEVVCPIEAVVVDAAGGIAQGLRGAGRCWVPGHPKSEAQEGSPFDHDPPPAGTEKILTWEATRP